MTAVDERQSVAQLAEQHGWQRKSYPQADIYSRGLYQVHTIWRDAAVLNAGSQHEDSVLLSYTRELAKVQRWLAK